MCVCVDEKEHTCIHVCLYRRVFMYVYSCIHVRVFMYVYSCMSLQIYLEKALGGIKVAELCNRLMLPCPITSVGNSHLADVLAGFSKPSSLASQPDSGAWGGSWRTDGQGRTGAQRRTDWQTLEPSSQGSSGPPQGQAEVGGQGEAGGAEGEGGWMNSGGKWVWVSGPPPGYRAVCPSSPPHPLPAPSRLSKPPCLFPLSKGMPCHMSQCSRAYARRATGARRQRSRARGERAEPLN